MTMLRNFAVLLVIVTFGCSNAMPTGGFEGKTLMTADGVKFRVETVATGLEVPWGFGLIPLFMGIGYLVVWKLEGGGKA